jgi:preprotein translocase subunit SecF
MGSAAIFTVMCFACGQWEVNLPTVSALLTAFSYAINDCVVVFDRTRFEVGRLPA